MIALLSLPDAEETEKFIEAKAAKAKENLVTHTADGYQGCQKSDKAVVDTKKRSRKIGGRQSRHHC